MEGIPFDRSPARNRNNAVGAVCESDRHRSRIFHIVVRVDATADTPGSSLLAQKIEHHLDAMATEIHQAATSRLLLFKYPSPRVIDRRQKRLAGFGCYQNRFANLTRFKNRFYPPHRRIKMTVIGHA